MKQGNSAQGWAGANCSKGERAPPVISSYGVPGSPPENRVTRKWGTATPNQGSVFPVIRTRQVSCESSPVDQPTGSSAFDSIRCLDYKLDRLSNLGFVTLCGDNPLT